METVHVHTEGSYKTTELKANIEKIVSHLNIYANSGQYSTCSDAACWGMVAVIACGVQGRMRGGAGEARAPRWLSRAGAGPLRRQTDLEVHARSSLATPSNAGPSRPGALQAPLTAYSNPLDPPARAKRHGRRRLHTRLAGQKVNTYSLYFSNDTSELL